MNLDRASLETKIADWLDREDLTAQIPDFIGLAEAELYRDLRCRDNEFVVTYDTNTAAGVHILLPENFKEMRLVKWDDAPLDHISDTEIYTRLKTGEDTLPCVFTIVERQLVLSAAVDNDPANWTAGSELVMTYYGTESLYSTPVWQTPTNPVDSVPTENTVTPITQSGTNTTRMLQVAPDLYFDGAMHYAYEYLLNQNMADRWGARFYAALASLKREHKRADFSGSTTTVNSAYGD